MTSVTSRAPSTQAPTRRAKARLSCSLPRSSSRTSRSPSAMRSRSEAPSSSRARGVPAALRASGTSSTENFT